MATGVPSQQARAPAIIHAQAECVLAVIEEPHRRRGRVARGHGDGDMRLARGGRSNGGIHVRRQRDARGEAPVEAAREAHGKVADVLGGGGRNFHRPAGGAGLREGLLQGALDLLARDRERGATEPGGSKSSHRQRSGDPRDGDQLDQ